MNRFLRACIAGIAVALILNFFAIGEGHAQIIAEILARMDAHSKSLASLKSNIRMVKVNTQLGETDVYEGSLTLLPKTENRPMYARIDWAKPVIESVAVIGGDYQVYRPRLGMLYTGKTTGPSKVPGGALGFLTMSKAQLKVNYRIEYLGQEAARGDFQTWHLKFNPKERGDVTSTDVWVDGDGMPLQVMTAGRWYSAQPLEQSGLTPTIVEMTKRAEEDYGVKINCDIEPIESFVSDTTTITLTGIRKNETVQGSIFKINVPKGTKVIKE